VLLDAGLDPRDYEVTINWGDGSTSAGWVRRTDDGFAVRGRRAYAKKGTRKVIVRITDGVGKGLDAKVTSTAVDYSPMSSSHTSGARAMKP
jgi:hypothetical protein